MGTPSQAQRSIPSRVALVAAFLALAACSAPRTEPAPASAAPAHALEAAVVVTTASGSAGGSIAELERLGVEDVEWTHHGETHVYRGAPLARLLEGEIAARASSDPVRSTWSRAVLVSARDDYRALFSAGEL